MNKKLNFNCTMYTVVIFLSFFLSLLDFEVKKLHNLLNKYSIRYVCIYLFIYGIDKE